MKIPFVDLNTQYKSIKNEIDSAIQKVIDETAFIKGKYVELFEKKYSEKYGVRNTVSCANGTDAIYIALKSMGIGRGDQVITTALSWISTSETISQVGATPVFVDIDPDYYTIDINKIEKKITNKTKAIIPVHLYGHPANMSDIMNIANKYKLKVIEDCAQAHFSQWDGKNVGTYGDVGTFSFFPGKNLGAYGDAGCIITNNDKLAETMRMYSNHGALVKHNHKFEGINSRLDGIQAAIILEKMKFINKWTEKRIKCASNYNELLTNENIVLPSIHPLAKHVFHLYVIRSKDRNIVQKHLNKNGISTGIHYPTALPFLEAYKYLNHNPDDFPVSYQYQSQILSLPIYPELSNNDQRMIINIIKEIL